MKIGVGITGASGVFLGVKFVEILAKDSKNEVFVIIAESAKKVAEFEMKDSPNLESYLPKNITLIKDSNLASPLSSGSFLLDAFCIIPTSMDTLAKVANGIADTAILRAAAVMIKEKRALLLAPREMPFSAIALNQMAALANLGVAIAPPVLGYYSKADSLEKAENFFIGKWLDLLKIPNEIYPRWQ